MAVTWTLKAADGSSLAHQPATGSPLALKFTNSGYPHLDGYPTELADTIVCVADTSTVTINLSPDNSGYTLDESASTVTWVPRDHGGSHSWTSTGGVTTIVVDVPTSSGPVYGWDYGQGEPAIALKTKVRVSRV